LIDAFEHFDPTRGALRTLVAAVARNSSIAWLRYNTTKSRTGVEVPVDHHGSGDENAVAVTSQMESQEEKLLKAEMQVAIKLLKEPCPELLKMCYYDELRHKEIAEMLGKKENTVTQEILRCIDELTAMVVELETEGGWL
jgi:RNA polymerase sigma factor (sigma-70 family)